MQDASPLPPGRLLELIDAAGQGIGIFDEADRLVHANDCYRRLLSLPEGDGLTWKDILRANHRDQAGNRISTPDFEAWLASAASRRGKLPFRAFEADLHGGRWIHVAETTLANGWMLCVLTDITELGADERSLRQQRDLAMRAALSDSLTGLSNRRHIQERLAALHRSGQLQEVALVLLDIDHFKRVNDSLGHDQGDALLRHFAALVQGQVWRDDLAGRWGGEEFLLVLRDVGREEVEQVLRRLFGRVRGSAPLPSSPGFRYSCSAGAAFAQAGDTVSQALRRADEALYAAKQGGRDAWVVR